MRRVFFSFSRRPRCLRDRGVERALSKPAQAHAEETGA